MKVLAIGLGMTAGIIASDKIYAAPLLLCAESIPAAGDFMIMIEGTIF